MQLDKSFAYSSDFPIYTFFFLFFFLLSIFPTFSVIHTFFLRIVQNYLFKLVCNPPPPRAIIVKSDGQHVPCRCSIKINMAEIKGCNSCIYQSTKNPPIDGVYFYPHTKASKFSTRKEWKRTACVRTLISSLERWCKTHYIISIDQAFISENFLQKRFPIVLINAIIY